MTNTILHASTVRWLALLPVVVALIWVAKSALWPNRNERLAWYDLLLRVLGAIAGSVVLLLGVAVNLGWIGR